MEDFIMFKKISVLIAALLTLCFSVTVYAALPTKITINETAKAPTVDGTVDSLYGNPIFNFKMSECDEPKNLWFSDKSEEIKAQQKINIVNLSSVGYATFNSNNFYMAIKTTDIAPKVAPKLSEYWKGTNIQVSLYVNGEWNFLTFSYTGKDSVRVYGDSRCPIDPKKVTAKLKESSDAKVITYEFSVPLTAFPTFTSLKELELNMAYCQSSMVPDYYAGGFGGAFGNDFNSSIVCELKGPSLTATSSTTSKTSSKASSTAASTVTSIVSESASELSVATSNASSSITLSTAASQVSETSSISSTVSSEPETPEQESNIGIIIAVIAGVLIIGGGAAFFILKSPKK
jgi:hypothetical protein